MDLSIVIYGLFKSSFTDRRGVTQVGWSERVGVSVVVFAIVLCMYSQ